MVTTSLIHEKHVCLLGAEDIWMGDLKFYALFTSIQVKSGRRMGDYERLCEMEPRFQLKRFPPSADQCLTF